MKISKMPKDELESYSYIELAEMILKEEKKSLDTPNIFKKICKLLELSDDDYENKIGDFYTTMTTDKTFILLDDGTWDLRDRHSSSVSLEDDDEDEEDEELTETEEEIENEMTDMAGDEYHEMDDDAHVDDTDLDDVDDIEDENLSIVDEDELD
ncbi:MAG: DNA-directed RNA polymerase subunit delta [Bacilli bacterium]|nr:DNA-directed RNA polymerase subunit delta [Bacilli bacterium]